MPIKIQGLPGLNRLSESERQQFMLNNEDRLRKYARDPMAQKRAAEILYDNMMFKNKLGSDLFNQLKAQGIGRDQRNEILRQSIIDEVAQRYNPIGKNGFRDNSKGLGENWEKFNQMSLDGKQKLLESEWKTPDELNASMAEESKTKGIGDILGDAWNRLSFGAVKGLSNLDFKEAITSLPKDLWGEVSAVLGMSSDIIGNIPRWFSSDDKVAATIGMLGGKEGAKQYLKMKNDKIFQNIYNNEADGSAERLGPQVSSEYMSQASKNLSDDQVKAAFIKAITPGSYVDEYGNPNRGVPMYAAYYRDGKDIEDEMKNFSIDEMRQFLAKKAAYDKYLSPEMAATALNNEAQRYIKRNQDSITRFGLWAKDVGIASLSYSADKVNGLYNLYLLGKDRLADGVDTGLGRVQLGERPTVYMDDRGRVLSPSKTKFYNGSDGKLYYDDENGNAHAVHRQQISNAALHNMGKNSEGEDLGDLWGTDWMTLDPTYWTKAEQFGTLDENELKQWEKLGASPYKVAYDPNEESSLWYEAFKMMSFGLADGAAMAIPFGIGMAGRALSTASQTGKVLGGIGKVLDGIGKGLTYQTTLGSTVQGSLGALGIAYAYERNAFQETLEKNLLDAEDTLLNRSRSLVFAKYQNDGDYKRNVDALIEKEKGSLGDYRKQLKANGYSDKAIDAAINARAQESVFNKLIQQDLSAARESQEYSNLQQQAINAASKAANISFLPEAIKYGIVNTVGYRKYLYTNPAGLKRKVSAALKGLQEVDKDGKKRLAMEGSKFGTRGQKMKEFSKIVGKQMWGGAWTNGTDDMMVDAAERISADQYNMYLNDFLTGSSMADTYGFADGLFSYINGLQNSLGQGTTWNAALVGGMGSVLSATPNMANIAHLMTKEGRNEYKNKFTRRPVRNESGEIVRNRFGEPVTEGIRWRDNPVERLSYFIQNGVLNSYYGAMQQERDLENHAMYVNDLLDQYEDFKMIEDVLSSDRHLEHADDEGTKKTMRFIKAIKANQLLDTLGERADDPTGLSSVIMRMKGLTERVANLEDNENSENPLSEEEIAEQIAQYYKANNVPQNEQNNEEALKVIVKNAKELMEANKAYRDALEDVNQIEQETGKTIPNNVKNKMMMVHALSKHWRERASQMMSEIGDIHSVNDIDADSDISNEDLLASVGGKAGANALSRVYERQTQEIEKAIEEAKEEVGKKEKALKDAEENLKKKAAEESGNLNQEIFNQAADLAEKRAELEDAKQKQKYLEDILFESNKHKGSINEALEEGKDKKNKTLTADEIFNLDVKTRARMLDKRNRNLYSIAQRREIEKLEKRIINEQGEGALQKIQDIALLANRIKMSEDAYSRMANNPAAADVHLESQRSAAAAEAHKLIDKRNARILAEYIGEAYDALKRRSDVSEEFLKDFVYRTLRKFNTSILDAIDDEAFLPIFQQEIDDARTWSKTLADITAVINNIDGTEEWRNMMLHNVDKIVNQASNKEEIMHSLEEAIDSLRESKEPMGKRAADDIEKLLVGMKRIGYQRDSAVIESREERKKREKEQDDRNKAAEEKLKTEEKKATEKPKNTESVDEGTVDMKAAKDVDFGEDTEVEEKKGPKEEGTTPPAGPSTPKTEKVTPENLHEHIQISSTSLEGGGEHVIFNTSEWSKYAVPIRENGWGKQDGHVYYTRDFVPETGRSVVTVWFKDPPSQAVREQIELFVDFSHRLLGKMPLNSPDTLSKILNGEKVFEEESTHKESKGLSKEEVKDQEKRVEHSKLLHKEDIVDVKATKKAFYCFIRNDRYPRKTLYLSYTYVGQKWELEVLGTDDKIKDESTIQEFVHHYIPKDLQEFLSDNRSDYLNATELRDKWGIYTWYPISDTYNTEDSEEAGIQGEQPAGESNPPVETNEDFVAESSSLEEQQKEAQQSSDNVKIVPTDSLESMEPSNASNIPPSGGGKKKKGVERDANLSGNRFAEWESLPLQGDKEKRIPKGRLIHKKGSKEGDHMNTFYNWLKLTGTKLQNIIDRELHQIMAVTPGHKVKVKFMLSRRDNGVLATGNDKIPSVTRVGMKNNLLLVVDYTPEVAKVHDEKNGGVFESNGKKYLLIGVAGGYDGTDQNSIRKKSYDIINSGGGGLASKGMKAFFDEHGNELYFVNDDVHTEIVESYPLPGWVVKALEGEPATGVLRNISDLLNDEKRNPYGLTLKSLPWAIVTRQSTIIVNNRDGKAVMKPNKEDTETGDEINVGNTFALIPASNGKLMPLMIQPRRLNEIRDGALKRNIYKAFEQLISKNREERLEAASKLEKYLYLNRQNGISIRVPKGNTIYFNRGQRTVATINITDSTTIQDVINIMENSNMNPRINITAGVLNDASSSNPALFKQYEEAGAFMLDAATLSTAGSSFMIYSLSEDGEIVRTPGSVNRNPAASSRGTTVKYKGDSYTEIEGSYYKVPEQASAEEIVDKELVTDPATINAIRYNFRIARGELRAEVIKGGWSYYIVNAGENPKVIRVDPSHAVEELSKEQSADFIKERQEAKEAAEREEKARKQLEKIEKNKKMEYREFHDEESGDDIRVVLDTDNSRLLFRNPDGSVWDYVYAQEFLDEVGFEGILRHLYGDDVTIANSSYETFTSKEYTGMKQTNEDAPIVLDDNTDSFIPDGKTIVPVGEMEVINFGDEDTGPAETSKGEGSTEETIETKESKKEGTIEDEKYVDVIEEELKRKKKATQTFEELYATHSRAIDEVVLDKWPDAPEDPTELKNFLKKKGITEIESIGTTQKDIDAFIRTIECVQK